MTFPDSENPPSEFPSRPTPVGAPEAHLPRPDENVPEDIRTAWGGGELLLLMGFAIGSLFLMEIVLELFLIAHYHMNLQQLKQFAGTSAALNVSVETVWSGLIFLFLFWTIRVYHRQPFWSSLRWRLLQPRDVAPAVLYLICIFGGIALAFANTAISSLVGETKNVPIQQLLGTRANVLWFMVFGICVAPFFEETIFRGYLYPVFARKWGIPAGIFITGLLFGLMHSLQLWGAWPQVGLLIVVGIILTFARARTGSVLASYLIHVSYNLLLFGGFFLTTHGLKNIPPLH